MSDPRFAELLEKYWAVAYQQGTEGRDYDDANGTAEYAELMLTEYVKDLAKDRDYWKVEAEGERAKVEFRDKQLERYRLTNTEENDLNILAHEIDAAARALREKP